MTKDEALKMAIEYIEKSQYEKHDEVINACKEALEQQEIGDAEIKQMLNDIEYYQKRVEELEQPAQECKWCKSREVNFEDWGDEASEKRQDVVGQNGPTGEHYEEIKGETK